MVDENAAIGALVKRYAEASRRAAAVASDLCKARWSLQTEAEKSAPEISADRVSELASQIRTLQAEAPEAEARKRELQAHLDGAGLGDLKRL